MAGVKSDRAAGLNGDGLAGAGVAPGTGRLGANLEVAKARNLDIVAIHQALRDEIEKRVDHVFRFALVQTDLLKQQVRQLRFGQRWGF